MQRLVARTKSFIGIAFIACVLGNATRADAKSEAQTHNQQASGGGPETKKKKKKAASKVTYRASPSEETPAERERRMRRECKGRPNAGACLGYTRP